MPAGRAANRKLSDSRFTKRLRSEEQQSGEESNTARSSYRAEAPSASAAHTLPDGASLNNNANVSVPLSTTSNLFRRTHAANARDDSNCNNNNNNNNNNNGDNSPSDFSSALANDELSYSSVSVSEMSNSLSRAPPPLPPLPPLSSSKSLRHGQVPTTELPESNDTAEVQTMFLQHQSLSTKERPESSSSSNSPRLPSSPTEPFMYYQFQKNTPSPSRSGSLRSSSSGGAASVSAEKNKREDNDFVPPISHIGHENGEETSENDGKVIQRKRNIERRGGSGAMKKNTSAEDDSLSTDDEATNEALETQQRAAVLEALRREMLQVTKESSNTKEDNNNTEKSDHGEDMAGNNVLPLCGERGEEKDNTDDTKDTEGAGVPEELSFGGAIRDIVCENVENEISEKGGKEGSKRGETEVRTRKRAVLESKGDSHESQEDDGAAVRGIHKQDTTDYGFSEGELTQVHRGLLTPLRTVVAAIHAHASVASAAPTANSSSPSRACIYDDDDGADNEIKEASKGRTQQEANASDHGPPRHSSPSLAATKTFSDVAHDVETPTDSPSGGSSSTARTTAQHRGAPVYQHPTPRELRAAYATAHKRLQRLPPHLMRAHIAMAQCKVPMHIRPMATIATYAATAAMGDLVEDFAAIRKAHGYL